jgi:hypothetical protein
MLGTTTGGSSGGWLGRLRAARLGANEKAGVSLSLVACDSFYQSVHASFMMSNWLRRVDADAAMVGLDDEGLKRGRANHVLVPAWQRRELHRRTDT